MIKFTPSDANFHKEYTYYRLAPRGIMAEMIDADVEYNAIVLRMIKPGFQVAINPDNPDIVRFFEHVAANLIPESALAGDTSVPNVYDEFSVFQEGAERFTYEYEFRKSMERKALKVWDVYFKDAEKYYIHRDFHRRNLLQSTDGILAIDARGAIGPKAFEYVIQFIIELRDPVGGLDRVRYERLFEFFSRFVGPDELRAALFFFFVYKMDGYVFQKNDNFRLAKWCKNCLVELFFEGVDDPLADDEMPRTLKRFA